MEYVTKSKTVVKEKILGLACTDHCKLKCKENITDETRQRILKKYWNDTMSIDMRRQFIASHVEKVPIKQRRARNNAREGKRQHTHKYFFERAEEKVIVCKIFFLNTLAISQQTVDTALQKKRIGGMVSPDKRGK